MPAPSDQRVLHKDELLVLLAVVGLLVLAFVTASPLFEALEKSRLTYFTALGLPVVVGVALVRRPSRAANVLRDFGPVLACVAVYENLKHLHANRITEWLGIAPKDAAMLRVDEALFGRALPLIVEPLATPLFCDVMWAFYVGAYYGAPLVVMSWVYFVREDDALFFRVRRALVTCLLGGYVSYLLIPVAGPLFTIGERFRSPILTQVVVQRLAFDGLRYNWDCFPSLHTAVPWLLVFVTWSSVPRVFRAIGVFVACGVTLSTVVLRFHYGIDLVAGVAWAAAVAWLSNRDAFARPFVLGVARARARRPLRRAMSTLGILFVVTGAAGLLAEQAFERLLSTLVGATTPTATLVLAIYFAGLTTGGLAYGRLAPRLAQPARAYALLEAGVALWALALYVGHEHIAGALHPLLSATFGTPWIWPARALAACVWILPPSLLMGATFPAVVDSLDALRTPEPKRAMATFYGLNLVGALAAAVLGPYMVLPRFGVDGALLLTLLLDGMVCILALRALGAPALARRFERARATLWRRPEPAAMAMRWNKPLLLVLAVSFASGFVFFSLEVSWTHLLAGVIGNSVYAFAAMLGLVLSSLALGGLLSAAIGRKRDELEASTVALALAVGAAMLSIAHRFWPSVPHRLATMRPFVSSFAEGEAARWMVAAIQIVPAATALGMVYPALFRLREFPAHARGTAAGITGAANAVGCVLGALVTGFVLLPYVGTERTLAGLAVITALAAVALLLVAAKSKLRNVALATTALALLVVVTAPRWDLLALTSGEHVYFGPNQVWPDSKLLFFHEDTLGGMTTVIENPAGVRGQMRAYRTLLTNGKFQGNDAWEQDAQTAFALIPAIHVRSFERTCVIGLGTGHSAYIPYALGFGHVDVAEIAPGIVRGAREYFGHVNGRLLEQPNVTLFLEDGRNVLSLHEATYDLISMELTSVWFAGGTSLYSFEFYEAAKRRLNGGGLMQQWIQLHHIDVRDIATVLATMAKSFRHVSFWVFGGQGILLGSDEPQSLRAAALERVTAAKDALGIERPEEVLTKVLESRLLTDEDVHALVQAWSPPVNTDRNRRLEYSTPRLNLSRRDHVAENLAMLAKHARFPKPELPADLSPALRAALERVVPGNAFTAARAAH